MEYRGKESEKMGRRTVRKVSRHSQREPQQEHRKDKVRFTQLLICVALFAVVFIGQGVFPGKLQEVRQEVLSLIRLDTDFRGALVTLGQSLSKKDAVFREIGEFCVAVFGSDEENAQQASFQIPNSNEKIKKEVGFLTSRTDQSVRAAHYLRLNEMPTEWLPGAQESQPQESQPAQVEEPTVPAVGTVLVKANYTGTPLPEGYTMDKISMGALETMAPLVGTIHSEYGYRDHPIDGAYKFHGGVDIGGQFGDPIHAFATGTVDYIGENDAYGMYVQLDHGNGIKSFYAHCSKLCVAKGDVVTMGAKIAEVGSTGTSTGPHLHFELKYNGTHLNPIDYLEMKS